MNHLKHPVLILRFFTQKKILLAIPATLLLTVAVIAYRGADPDHRSRYEFATVRRGDVVQRVFSTGIIHATTAIQVGTQVPGRVEEIYVDYNSPVRKGMLLALIEPRSFEAQLAQAEANLAVAKAQLEKMALELGDSELNLKRKRNLFDAGSISRSDLDAAETAYAVTCAERKAQEERIAQCEGAVKLARISLEHTRITSPIDGVVLSRNVELGEIVTVNSQSPSLFQIASNLTRITINIDVSEADIGNVKVGQKVSFTVDAYPGRSFNGKVMEVRVGPIIKQNTVYYTVLGYVDNAGLLLKPGMTADAWIQTASKENVLTIPILAFHEQRRKHYVALLEGKEVKEREIAIGIKGEGGIIEVLSGLNEGEQVIVQDKQR